jgi:hypothetical protein
VNARWLHLEGLVWSNRKLLDCRIPTDQLRKFATEPAYVQELVDHGYWGLEAGVYVIRHGAMYQRTKDAVIKAQDVSRANGRKHAGKKPGVRGSDLPEPSQVPVQVTQPGSQTGSDQIGTQTGLDDDPRSAEPSQVPVALTQGVRSGQDCSMSGSSSSSSTSSPSEPPDPWADVVVAVPGKPSWSDDLYDRER